MGHKKGMSEIGPSSEDLLIIDGGGNIFGIVGHSVKDMENVGRKIQRLNQVPSHRKKRGGVWAKNRQTIRCKYDQRGLKGWELSGKRTIRKKSGGKRCVTLR